MLQTDLFEELKRLVSYRTESATASGRIALKAYLEDVLVPALAELGCDTELHPHWDGGTNSFLIGTRFESEGLPTVLCYGHADVVGGQDDGWDDDRSPWILDADGDRWYGRGTADNKGQHLINLAALRILLESNGHLGFNLKFLFECGEEIGSPSLDEFSSVNKDKLAADVFIASDGPRLSADSPTIFLGSRGGITFELDVNLRSGSYHSGNWGRSVAQPGDHTGSRHRHPSRRARRILLPELLPTNIPESVQTALSNIAIPHTPGDPHIDTDWADTGLTPAERLYGWNARRFWPLVPATSEHRSTRSRARHVRYSSSGSWQARRRTLSKTPSRPTSTATDSKWCGCAKRHSFPRAASTPPIPGWNGHAVPSTAPPASCPRCCRTSAVPCRITSLRAFWGFSFGSRTPIPGCLQHAPDEHMLASIASHGLQIACGSSTIWASRRQPEFRSPRPQPEPTKYRSKTMNPAPKASPTGTVVAGPEPSPATRSETGRPRKDGLARPRGCGRDDRQCAEWFDMSIYALLAIYIGRNFFPSDNPATGVIQAFAVFGASYLIRPLGGLVLGPMPTGRASKRV